MRSICQATAARPHWMKKKRHDLALEKYQRDYAHSVICYMFSIFSVVLLTRGIFSFVFHVIKSRISIRHCPMFSYSFLTISSRALKQDAAIFNFVSLHNSKFMGPVHNRQVNFFAWKSLSFFTHYQTVFRWTSNNNYYFFFLNSYDKYKKPLNLACKPLSK